MRRPFLIAALVGTLMASPASADVTVRYRAIPPANAAANARANMPDLTVSADDAGKSRIEVQAPGTPAAGARQPGVALITRDDVDYVAFSGPQPGMQIIGRMDDAMALAAQFATPLLRGSARDGVNEVMRQRVEIIPVGPEMVSGIAGNLYRIVVVNGETRSPPLEMVVATDPRLAPVGRAFVRMFDAVRPAVIAGVGGEPQVLAAARAMMTLGAPLRIGTFVRIEPIDTADVPDSQFALPGPVMSREQLQQMATMMMGMMGRGQGMHPPGAPGAHPAPPGNAANPH